MDSFRKLIKGKADLVALTAAALAAASIPVEAAEPKIKAFKDINYGKPRKRVAQWKQELNGRKI